MDAFADLTISEKRNVVSRVSTPMNGNSTSGRSTPGHDSFADLMQGTGAKKTNMASMSLLERQNQISKAKSRSPTMSMTSNDNWSGLDLLSDNIRHAELIKSPKPPLESTAPAQAQNQSGSDNIDDIFDVFNRPPPPPIPVSPPVERKNDRPESPDTQSSIDTSNAQPFSDPRDSAIAELLDMGFSMDQAARALDYTDDGLNVEQAIDYLMNEAHRRSKPVTNKEKLINSEQDIGKMAQEISNQFFKTANNLWNSGRKNLARAIETYNSNNNDGAPAWMRDRDSYLAEEMQGEAQNSRKRNGHDEEFQDDMTDEVSRLESSEPPPKPNRSAKKEQIYEDFKEPAMPQRQPGQYSKPVLERAIKAPDHKLPVSSSLLSRAQQFKTKGLIEDEVDSYISPARRKVKPSPPVSKPSTPILTRPNVEISATALQMAALSREAGTEAFKRGDFTQAAVCYSQALESIPAKHLLRTIVLSNRAACNQKLGDSKSVLKDAEEGLVIIGPGLGATEVAEEGKSLKDIWSKLMTKKAEAYEHLEKFKEALETWNMLMNNGYSSRYAMESKRRCQQALQPKPAPTSRSSTPSSVSSGPTSKAGKEAVQRVRDAHKQAERTDAEKYVLLDSVEARISAWKDGKEDNLRALIASLDTILWSELEWRKVSMADLIVVKKVKINYMKAVAKTHPDKISSSASTEQKMIAQAVFITLNKSWDLFKEQNSLQ